MSEEMNISEMLAEQLDRLFTDRVDRDLLVSVEEGKLATDLWNEIEALGITSALVAEEKGGAGLAWADIEPAIRAVGRHSAPVPLPETLLAHWILAGAGITIPEGPIAVMTTVMALDGSDKLSGACRGVSWVPQCASLVAVAEREGAYYACLINRDDCQLESEETLAREPQSSVQLSAVTPQAFSTVADEVGELGLLPYLASLRAIQIGGALDQLVDLCVEYGNTREQFGKPIGRFQAIQHGIAQLASHTAACQVAGQFACRQIDAGNAEYGAMVSKTRAGQAAGGGAEIAHQVFGAIGFTDEHILHYFTRRLWQWRAEAGSEFWWSERLGQQVIARGGDNLWSSITD